MRSPNSSGSTGFDHNSAQASLVSFSRLDPTSAQLLALARVRLSSRWDSSPTSNGSAPAPLPLLNPLDSDHKADFHPLQSPEPDYETVLSALESSIQSRQARLQTIQLRERRANAVCISYGFAAWVIYVAVWYWNQTFGFRHNAANGVPVVAGPIV